jgi:hypothetical protein
MGWFFTTTNLNKMTQNLTKTLGLQCLCALTLLAGASTAANAGTVSLDMNSGGWVSNYDATSLDPRNHYGQMPSIETSGAAFEAANPGWRTLGYNDSAWSAYSGGWVPGDGSRSPMYLRKSFTIGTPTAGSFYLEVDDDSQVWINNVLVPALDDHSNSYNGGHSADISSFLQAGNNVIAIKADNTPGGGYYIGFSGSVSFSERQNNVPEPVSLALVGLGLVAAGVAKRKQRG